LFDLLGVSNRVAKLQLPPKRLQKAGFLTGIISLHFTIVLVAEIIGVIKPDTADLASFHKKNLPWAVITKPGRNGLSCCTGLIVFAVFD